MLPNYASDKISCDEIENQVQWNKVSKEAKPLEDMRQQSIPETIQQRKQDGDAFLEKTELIVLAEWRSRRAKTYSSKAGELVAVNTVSKVRDASRKAFSLIASGRNNISNAIKALQELEGVPLQTATLVLSMYDPYKFPCFTDELDRYLHWNEARREGRPASKTVSHTAKEYSYICDKIQEMQTRIKKESGKDVRATDIEIAAHRFAKLIPGEAAWGGRNDDLDDAVLVPEEKPRKKRKTNAEIYEEEHPRGSDKDYFKDIHNCVDKGPNGSPTYDKAGFQLDYDKCVNWEKPMYVSSMKPTLSKMKKAQEHWDRQKRERQRMAELMDDDQINVDDSSTAWLKEDAYKERVRNDLGKATYHVSMDEFEHWYKMGFRAKKGEFDLNNMSPERKAKYKSWMEGSALRK